MATKNVLDALATKYVGDGRSNLIFVTDDDGVVAIFDGREFMSEAKQIADRMTDPCIVEDKHGVAHENRASRRRQKKDD